MILTAAKRQQLRKALTVRWARRRALEQNPEGLKVLLLERRVIDPITECWMWSGARSQAGYGRIKIGGRSRLVHRVAAEVFGLSGDGPAVIHRCDRPPCFNPQHLQLGSQAENMADASAKGRLHGVAGQAKPHPGLRRLGPHHIARIRSLWPGRLGRVGGTPTGQTTLRGLAREFGVSYSVIAQIVRGLTYKDVQTCC